MTETLSMLELAFRTYMHVKQKILYTAIQQWIPEVQVTHTQEKQMSDVTHQLSAIVYTLQEIDVDNFATADLGDTINTIRLSLNSITRTIHQHLNNEEILLRPLSHHFLDLPSAVNVMQQMWNAAQLSTWRAVLPWRWVDRQVDLRALVGQTGQNHERPITPAARTAGYDRRLPAPSL